MEGWTQGDSRVHWQLWQFWKFLLCWRTKELIFVLPALSINRASVRWVFHWLGQFDSKLPSGELFAMVTMQGLGQLRLAHAMVLACGPKHIGLDNEFLMLNIKGVLVVCCLCAASQSPLKTQNSDPLGQFVGFHAFHVGFLRTTGTLKRVDTRRWGSLTATKIMFLQQCFGIYTFIYSGLQNFCKIKYIWIYTNLHIL